MAKHLLSARRVQTSRKGVYGDGAGLRLRVKATGASWLLRYTAPSGKLRELGLGAADRASTAAAGKSLREARDAADAARRLIRSGVDPIDEKRAKRAKAREVEAKAQAEARRERTTLARVARAYHERVVEPRRTDVHAREWISSLERHVPKEIWHKPIDRIEAPELLDAVVKVTLQYPETGRRVRQRLDWSLPTPNSASFATAIRAAQSVRRCGRSAAGARLGAIEPSLTGMFRRL